MCTLIENVGSVVTGSPYHQQSDPDEKIKKIFLENQSAAQMLQNLSHATYPGVVFLIHDV